MSDTMVLNYPIFKADTNLLSVISLVVLLTMVFMTAAVLASHCEPEEKALTAALTELGLATAALAAALLTGQLWAIAIATGWFIKAGMAVDAAYSALERCEKEHRGSVSGGCGSGGCS